MDYLLWTLRQAQRQLLPSKNGQEGGSFLSVLACSLAPESKAFPFLWAFFSLRHLPGPPYRLQGQAWHLSSTPGIPPLCSSQTPGSGVHPQPQRAHGVGFKRSQPRDVGGWAPREKQPSFLSQHQGPESS